MEAHLVPKLSSLQLYKGYRRQAEDQQQKRNSAARAASFSAPSGQPCSPNDHCHTFASNNFYSYRLTAVPPCSSVSKEAPSPRSLRSIPRQQKKLFLFPFATLQKQCKLITVQVRATVCLSSSFKVPSSSAALRHVLSRDPLF